MRASWMSLRVLRTRKSSLITEFCTNFASSVAYATNRFSLMVVPLFYSAYCWICNVVVYIFVLVQLTIRGRSIIVIDHTNTSVEQLRTQVKGRVILPQDVDYDQMRHGHNLSIDHHPAVILVPVNAQ